MTECCDYCFEPLPTIWFARATEVDHELNAPVIKAWCGSCDPPDDIDPEAHRLLIKLTAKPKKETP